MNVPLFIYEKEKSSLYLAGSDLALGEELL